MATPVFEADPYTDMSNVQQLSDGTFVGSLPEGGQFTLTADEAAVHRARVSGAYNALPTYRKALGDWKIAVAEHYPTPIQYE